MSAHNVFVYGTLKRGEPNHNWINDTSKGSSEFIGVATTVQKYPLVIASRYNIPFLLDAPGVGSNVTGEVYHVDEGMLHHLDILEDHPNFYVRELQQVQLQNVTGPQTQMDLMAYDMLKGTKEIHPIVLKMMLKELELLIFSTTQLIFDFQQQRSNS